MLVVLLPPKKYFFMLTGQSSVVRLSMVSLSVPASRTAEDSSGEEKTLNTCLHREIDLLHSQIRVACSSIPSA
jgi:hypothetical protein